MLYREFSPHLTLIQDIKCYWILERPTGKFSSDKMPPDSYMELVFDCSQHPDYLSCTPRVFLVGLQNSAGRIYGTQVSQSISVRLYPWMALPLVGVAPHQSINTVIPLTEKWTALGNHIAKRAHSVGLVEAVVEIEQHLADFTLYANTCDEIVRYASKLIYLSKGQIRINNISDECGISTNQLERLFKTSTGISPKAFARLVRIEAIREYLVNCRTIRFVDVAQEFGYTDQSHFSRDFKAMAGVTPGQFVSYINHRSTK